MISVIIPNYNHAFYLEQRIESILSQNFKDFEVIILDDKSTDNSKEIIEKYRNHPHISTIIYNEANSGSTFIQWNKGVSLSKGEFVLIAESDDFASPDLLTTLYENIISDDHIVLSFCQSYRVNNKGDVTGDWLSHTQEYDLDNIFTEDFTMEGKEFIRKFLIHKNTIPNASGVLFRKSTFETIGGADTNIGYIGDWMTWLKISSMGKISFSAKKLNYFRYHDQSVVSKVWTKDVPTYKQPHIDVRLRYNEFLKKINIDHEINIINKQKLANDYADEAYFFTLKKEYSKVIKNYFLFLKYSTSKGKAIIQILTNIKHIVFK